MKQDTQDMKPLRKLLKGKVPTRQQYTNWVTPVKNTYNKYASIILSFLGVFFVYSDENLYSTVNAVISIDFAVQYYRSQMFENFSRIHAWQSMASNGEQCGAVANTDGGDGDGDGNGNGQ